MIGLKGISQTLGCSFLKVAVLPSSASTIRSKAPSIGEPDTSRLKTDFLPPDFFPSASGTKSALLQRTAIRARFFHVEVRRSKETAGVVSAPVSTSPILLSSQTWATVGWFFVSVPVLSHRRTEVEPK